MSGQVYIFAGGGTGGHLFPGIAIARQLIEMQPHARIVFVGTDRSLEREILATTPFEHRAIPAVSLANARRSPLRFPADAWRSYRAAMRTLIELMPACVIGCGGFASIAPILAARRQGVPFVLLEQNVIPGRATRLLSRLNGTVCLSYAQTASFLPRSANTVVTGNPVRPEIARLVTDVPEEKDKRTLLILGGSQGAKSINDLMVNVAAKEPGLLSNWRIIHQTGARDAVRVRSVYAEHAIDADVADFFCETASLYCQATIVVSRAGGTTLSEIACAGLPAMLLPYPHAAADHQWHNAEYFRQAGAAVLFDERSVSDDPVAGFLTDLSLLLNEALTRERMRHAMLKLARPHAAEEVAKMALQFGAP